MTTKTPNFDKITQKDKRIAKASLYFLIILSIALAVNLVLFADHVKKKPRSNTPTVVTIPEICGYFILFLGQVATAALPLTLAFTVYDKKTDKIKAFHREILDDQCDTLRLRTRNYEKRQIIIEYILSLMNDQEKHSLYERYKETDFNDEDQVDTFIAKVSYLFTKVEIRNPMLRKTIDDIICGKTIPFPNDKQR